MWATALPVSPFLMQYPPARQASGLTSSVRIITGSMNSAMKDILNVMNKMMALGMNRAAIINSVTWKPAQVIHREQLGNLSLGSEGDVTILRIRKGKFGFDQMGQKLPGKHRFECEATIKGGRVFYDLNGLTTPVPRVAGGLPAL